MKKLLIVAALASIVAGPLAINAYNEVYDDEEVQKMGEQAIKTLEGKLFHVFEIFHNQLSTLKKTDEAAFKTLASPFNYPKLGDALQAITSHFDKLLEEALKKNSKILEEKGPYGLTPAHLLVLKAYLSATGDKKEDRALGLPLTFLYNYAFPKLSTPEAVQVALEPKEKECDMYNVRPVKELCKLGIGEKAMTAEELKETADSMMLETSKFDW